MSKVFGTIAAVLLAAAAFVAFKNQEALVKEAGNSKENKKGLLQVQQDKKAFNQKEFASESKRLDDADAERKEHVGKEAEVAKVLADLTSKYEEAKKSVDSLKDTHKTNETEIASAEDALKGLPDPEELIPKIKRMTAELSAAESGIASEEGKLANLVRNEQNGKVRIKVLRDLIDRQTTGKSFPNMKTSISSVYRNWGFVILAAGDKQGVITGSILDVVRGGEVVGKLKVTAVESGRAAADIVLDSVSEGTTLRSGDRVVPEKEEVAAPAAPAPAPAPVAPVPAPAEEPAAADEDPF